MEELKLNAGDDDDDDDDEDDEEDVSDSESREDEDDPDEDDEDEDRKFPDLEEDDDGCLSSPNPVRSEQSYELYLHQCRPADRDDNKERIMVMTTANNSIFSSEEGGPNSTVVKLRSRRVSVGIRVEVSILETPSISPPPSSSS